MKRGKKPSVRMKKMIQKQKIGNRFLDPEKWLVRVVSFDKAVLIHKETGNIRDMVI